MTPEGRVKARVDRELNRGGLAYYKFKPVQNGMGAPGLDYYTCIRGWFVAIETKVEGKKLTPRQASTAKDIVTAGGTVFVIRNDYDIEYMMNCIKGGLDVGTMFDTLQGE